MVREIECTQGSEEWEALRRIPTASNFGRIVTEARGQYAKSAGVYAAELVAKRLGVWTEPPPSFWQEWGLENEPLAREAYQRETGHKVREVGFVLHESEGFGGSPDGLVDPGGGVELKCPKPETLIGYHRDGVCPPAYRGQVQGLLLVTGREWWDFYAWHPALKPFLVRVEPDEAYQAKIADGIGQLLAEVEKLELAMQEEGW